MTLFYIEAINGLVALPINQTLEKCDPRTRGGANNFKHIRANKSLYANSFFPKTVIDWNNLDQGTKTQTSLSTFKSALKH